MLTIGDSFSIVAILVGLAATAWSFIIVCALLVPYQVEACRRSFSKSTWGSLWIGLGSLALVLIAIILLSLPSPLTKALGWLVLSAHLSISFLGIAGIVKLGADRHLDLAQNLSPIANYSRTAAYVVTAGLLPILGWFLFAPAVYVLGAGAGFRSLWSAKSVVAPPEGV